MVMHFIKNLSDNIENLSPALIGGKAFSLARLYKRNFLIPDAFIITTEAFDYFLGSQLDNSKNILSQINNNSDYLKIYLDNIQQKIASGRIPSDLSEVIYNSFISLNRKFVAVRSSATIEDGSNFSFAGQFESFLGVAEEDLLAKVKSCWASLFNHRAIAYLRSKKNFGKMAVIVQDMVDADVSGVCFSINPVTNDQNLIIIEAVLGLGELLVQGAIIPDHYRINKETLIIEEKNVNMNLQKERLGLDTSIGGTKKYYISPTNNQNQKLSDERLKEIANVALMVEKFYNRPVDIEWALKDSRLYLLQARPITTL